MKQTLIIDGHNLAFRSYHLIKAKYPNEDIITKKDDIIYIFLNSFISYYKLWTTFSEVIFTWDHKLDHGEANFRKSLVPYKENRENKDDAVFAIIDELLTITKNLGCKNILPKSLEADDIIYYICKHTKGEKLVISSDKDLLQLVSEDTTIYSPNKKIIYNKDNFKSLMGMETKDFVVYKAILGDVSDNIPGVPRYGEKKALKMALNWEEAKSNFNEEQMEIVERNLKIMDLSRAKEFCDESEFSYYEEQLNTSSDFNDEFIKELFKEKNYKKFLFNFHEWDKLRNSYVDFLQYFE